MEAQELLEGDHLRAAGRLQRVLLQRARVRHGRREAPRPRGAARAQWIRTLFMELGRLHNHLIFLGTGSIDLGGIALLFYCFRERDRVLDLFELATGVRMHDRYAQVGGVAEDLPKGFDNECRAMLVATCATASTSTRADRRAADLPRPHPRHRRRSRRSSRARMGLTGPNARASGVDWDLRIHQPDAAYPEVGPKDPAAPERRHLRPLHDAALRDAPVVRHHRALPRRAAAGPVDRRRPQGRAAAAPRAAHLDGVADPPLQAGDRGLPGARRRGLRGPRGAARRARLPPGLRRHRRGRSGCTSARPAW